MAGQLSKVHGEEKTVLDWRGSPCALGLVDHRLGHVMKELDERIEWSVGRRPSRSILRALRLVVAGTRRRLAGNFAGLWHHCIDDTTYATRTCSHTRGAVKPASDCATRITRPRLTTADCTDDRRRILGEPSGVICRRERDGDSLVTALLELRRNQVPIPCTAAGTGYEDEGEPRH